MIILYSIIPALCLSIGFYFGFKLGKTNELPNFKKTEEIQENSTEELVQGNETEEKDEETEEMKEIKRLGQTWSNLNNYDGSSKGQEEVL
jgi:hypothetical protein